MDRQNQDHPVRNKIWQEQTVKVAVGDSKETSSELQNRENGLDYRETESNLE